MSQAAALKETGYAGHGEALGFWRKYVFSIDHKTIAKQYLGISLFMALVGAYTAYAIRWQLAWPLTRIPGVGAISPDAYNSLVTMHGTIMVFFVAMPLLLGAFGNFCIPLMVGAADMAFPRLNMLSVWTFFTGGLVLLASLFVPGGAAAAGWTSYAPLSANPAYTTAVLGQDMWIVALALEFASFLMGGVNFLTTALNVRAPGMSLWRMPLLVWYEITASALFLLSVGPLIGGAVMLLLDRVLGTGFYLPAKGGDPLLWEHLFWFFGHPEVYVVALPGFGIMLEILPVFSRKPVFAYRALIYCALTATALSLIVWAHHMFVSGMDPRLATPFSVTTILISVPFAIMVFAMIATLWGGSMTFETPMLFALGGLASFLLGGVTGIFLGSAATDIYLHGTYFVVAHFHYTLFPVTFFAGFAGLYYWYPKMFGRMMNERLGKLHFWLTFFGFQAVFIPLFLVGVAGTPRRVFMPVGYPLFSALQPLQVFATVAAIVLIAAQAAFVANFFLSLKYGKQAQRNPWRANTLEWSTDSPPPHENFPAPPQVRRWPYEYSTPGARRDWMPQDEAAEAATVRAAS
ncbi:MAG TPA: cbb3-type cytochrome c oxidase subunit I [Candidatus Binataceae bacterium]|jgi:cytochrome c oxidase subunit 1|nr:cbb3-type cytochrome c oxidase subunit I [Candidatus Binataceae bacterium]